jgi:outer membrane protein OmpA-like peptidoglycan-associated protein
MRIFNPMFHLYKSWKTLLLLPLWLGIILPAGLRAQETALKPSATHDLVQGVVSNERKEGVSGIIEFLNPATDKIAQTAPLNEKGEFSILLPKNQKYYFVIRDGCFTYFFKDDGHIMETSKGPAETTIDMGFTVYQLESGTEIILSTLVFPSSNYTITEAHHACLDQLAAFLKAHPTMRVQVTGHTDNVGSPTDNKTLSKNRALAVKEYMTGTAGIAEDRLTAFGYGDSLPATTNDTETGRAINRRVSFIIIKP